MVMYISFFSVGCMYAKLPKILIFCFLLGWIIVIRHKHNENLISVLKKLITHSKHSIINPYNLLI